MNTRLLIVAAALTGMGLCAKAEEKPPAASSASAVSTVPAGSAGTEAAEGLSPREKEVLRKHYQWKKGESLPTAYSLEELHRIMDDSADNTLELEDYDWQVRKLVIALMVTGDRRFAKELDGRAVPVQKEAITMLRPLWEKHQLRYPEVEEIAAAIKRLSSEE